MAASVSVFASNAGAQSNSNVWPEDSESARVRGADLRASVPDLQVRAWPPRTMFDFGFVEYFPFQLFGLGASMTVYAPSWLRTEVAYSAGASIAERWSSDLAASNYAHAFVGVRVLGGPSERPVDLMPDENVSWWRRKRPRPAPFLRAWLPSHHALFLEAGLITGLFVFARCVADCALDPTEHKLVALPYQLVFPVGGLRYVYFIDVRSKRLPVIDRRMIIEVYAHAITRPVYDPRYPLWAEAPVRRSTLGGRFGFEVPTRLAGHLTVGICVGYVPDPGSLILQSSIGARF